MGISGIVQSYDSRAASSAAPSQTIMAPQYAPAQAYSGATIHNMAVTHQQPHNPFSFSGYPAPNANLIIPAFADCNFIQPSPLPRLIQVNDDGSQQVSSYPRASPQSYIEEHHSRSPLIKSESMWPTPTNAPVYHSIHSTDTRTSPISSQGQEINFGTDVDTLMKAIQAKAQITQPPTTSSAEQIRPVVGAFHATSSTQATSQIGMHPSGDETKYKLTNASIRVDSSSPKNSKKRYQCTIANCGKIFPQKTHLDIHERAHTGVKPYPCKQPGCGRTCSQLGNLKAHERRHTGERPYQCDICGKCFPQRGNVRAHKITHEQSKPYQCRLDSCRKFFTQRGNLKGHQNKFHIETIRTLTAKFASIKDGDMVTTKDREMWEYFANLYKNSNKGIKGRGKNRKVGSASTATNPTMHHLSSGMSRLVVRASGRGPGNMIVSAGGSVMGGGTGSHVGGRGDGGDGTGAPYNMLAVEDGSQSGHSHTGSGVASSVGTCYDDAPSDGYEDQGRSHELVFRDSIY